MADNSKFIQTQTFKLAGGGISLSDTSISLQSFKFPDGNVITMSHIGALGTGTLEPGASKEEIISFTGVTQNGDGSATLTGVTRGLKFGDTAGDYGQNLALRKSHAGNTSFVITNNPQFYNKFAAKDNDEVITGDWQVPTPANGASVANKDYVNAAIGGGIGTATDTTFGTVKGTKNQGSKPKVISALVREQATPDKTLKIESFRHSFIDTNIVYAGGNTPNFIDPAMGGDLAFALTPSNGETITITVDGTACVFTAVTSIGATPGNFLIGGSASIARANLVALINNPTVTNANQVAFTGAQLTAIQKLSATDDLSLNTFIRVTNPATATFSVTETMAGAGNIWTANTTKNRYDLVVVDSSSVLQIRKGVEAVSPAVPTPTSGDCVLALVLNRVGQSTLRDTSVSGQGYIVELYTPSIYRTDIATILSLPVTQVTYTAGEAITIGQPLHYSPYTQNGLPVTYDSNNSGNFFSGTSNSISITVGNNSNRLLIADIMVPAGAAVTSVTYNGVAMTQIDTQALPNSGNIQYSFRLIAPSTGANNLTVNTSGSLALGLAVIGTSYYNADQTTPVEVSAKSTTSGGGTFNQNITPLTGGAMLHAGYAYNATSGTSTISFGGIAGVNLVDISGTLGSAKANAPAVLEVPAAITIANTHTGSSFRGVIALAIKPSQTQAAGVVKASAAAGTTFTAAKQDFVGFATQSVTAGSPVITQVALVATGLSGLTIGKYYYLQNTAGAIGLTAGTVSKIVAKAISTTTAIIIP